MPTSSASEAFCTSPPETRGSPTCESLASRPPPQLQTTLLLLQLLLATLLFLLLLLLTLLLLYRALGSRPPRRSPAPWVRSVDLAIRFAGRAGRLLRGLLRPLPLEGEELRLFPPLPRPGT